MTVKCDGSVYHIDVDVEKKLRIFLISRVYTVIVWVWWFEVFQWTARGENCILLSDDYNYFYKKCRVR